jgi:putative flippase GtrA
VREGSGWRWIKFSLVGGLGVLVQLGLVAALTALQFNYLAATALAVEGALLHNFWWHRRFTWADRTTSHPVEKGLRHGMKHLLRFHLSNGMISIFGNLILMWLFVSKFGLAPLLANAAAIALCFVANFLSADRWVFSRT